MIKEIWTMALLSAFSNYPPYVAWSEPVRPEECKDVQKNYRSSRVSRETLVCIQAPAWFIYPSNWTVMNGKVYTKKDGEWVPWNGPNKASSTDR